jgi:CRISPR-associated protein Csh2
LQNLVSLSEESEPPLRSVNDVVLNVSDLVAALGRVQDRIETVHVVGDEYLTLEHGEETHQASEFGELLESEGHTVHEIDVLDERDFAE